MILPTLILSLALVIFGGVLFGRHVVRPLLRWFYGLSTVQSGAASIACGHARRSGEVKPRQSTQFQFLSRFRDSDNRRSDKFHNPSVGAVTHGAAFDSPSPAMEQRTEKANGLSERTTPSAAVKAVEDADSAAFTLRTAMKLNPTFIL